MLLSPGKWAFIVNVFFLSTWSVGQINFWLQPPQDQNLTKICSNNVSICLFTPICLSVCLFVRLSICLVAWMVVSVRLYRPARPNHNPNTFFCVCQAKPKQAFQLLAFVECLPKVHKKVCYLVSVLQHADIFRNEFNQKFKYSIEIN